MISERGQSLTAMPCTPGIQKDVINYSDLIFGQLCASDVFVIYMSVTKVINLAKVDLEMYSKEFFGVKRYDFG